MKQEKIEYLPLDAIEVAPQVRTEFSEESLRGLAATMLQVGQLQPIRVRRDGEVYVVVDGERRLRAAKMSGGFATLAAIIEEGALDAAAVQQRQLVANCQKEDLMPLEKARAIHELMKRTGGSASETASMLGFSCATVSKLLALLDLPESIQAKVGDGSIPASAGYDLSRIADADQQAALAEQIVSGQLNRDAVSGIVKRRRSPQAGDKPKNPARVRIELGAGRSITLAGEGLDGIDSLIGWLEELLGKARKLRPKGLALATFVRILKDEAKADV